MTATGSFTLGHNIVPFSTMPLPGLWGTLWAESERAYQTAAQAAEQATLVALAERERLAAYESERRAIIDTLDIAPPPFRTGKWVHDAESDMDVPETRPAKNLTEQAAINREHLARMPRYVHLSTCIADTERAARMADATHERAVLDCRMARLRLDMMVAALTGLGIAGALPIGVPRYDAQGRPFPSPEPEPEPQDGIYLGTEVPK